MEIKKKLESMLHDAMKTNNELRKRTIRLVLANIKQAEIDTRTPLDEVGIFGVLQKEVKSRKEAIEDAKMANRNDLVSEAEAEIKILEEFLPAPIGEEALRTIARSAIEEISASGLRDMGRVIKIVAVKVGGRAGGELISRIVRTLLENK